MAPTKIVIDTEFNGFGGQLLSMAMVASTGVEFYEVLPCRGEMDPWVARHVWPIIGKDPVEIDEFKCRLQAYLEAVGQFVLIADWPDDLRYFCEMIMIGPGEMMDIPRFDMAMDRRLAGAQSRVPHNALEDARAIARMIGIVKEA